MVKEKTLVLIKPDGVGRGVAGEIISRFERVGLKMVACKMVVVPPSLAEKHYGYGEEWFENVGKKLLEFYKENGKDANEEIGTMQPKEIGRLVQKWNVDFLTEGPVLAIVWQGPHAVAVVRKLVGPTYPHQAPPGTIRGDYSLESPLLANTKKRSVRNLIHASGTVDEAKTEIELWFREKEIAD